jgi:hypothetical protein
MIDDKDLYPFVVNRFPPKKALAPEELIKYCKHFLKGTIVRERVERDYARAYPEQRDE